MSDVELPVTCTATEHHWNQILYYLGNFLPQCLTLHTYTTSVTSHGGYIPVAIPHGWLSSCLTYNLCEVPKLFAKLQEMYYSWLTRKFQQNINVIL